MIIDLIYSISSYMNDKDFIEHFGVIKDPVLNKRRNDVNRKRIANCLKDRILEPLGIRIPEELSIFKSLLPQNGNPFNFTYQELLMYVANGLLGKKQSQYEYTYYYSKQHKMEYTYATNGSFYAGLDIVRPYRIKRNAQVCAVYRLPYASKKYLLEQTPLAKALIY